MAVRIRLKRMGRKHRPFFRVCAIDSRKPRDGKVIEELGTYDPMLRETDARAQLNGERVDYWLSVGAQPSDKVKVLIKKYGSSGTHLEQQREAIGRLEIKPTAPAPVVFTPKPKEEPAAEATEEAATEGAATEEAAAPETAEAAPAEAEAKADSKEKSE